MPDPIPTLQSIIARGLAYGQEHEAIAQALAALGLDPTDLEHDHPLIDLYQALHIASRANDVIYLSRLHRNLLTEALQRLQRDAIDGLRRQATADRLRLMVRRSAAYADEFLDLELALDAIGIDFSEDCADDELVGLYHDLVADDARGEPRYLSAVERVALLRAARVLAKGKDQTGG